MKKIYLLLPFCILFFTACFNEEKEVKFYGNVDVRTVSLAFRVSGRLDTLDFDEGQDLKKGDVIATIENSIFKENLNQINAQIKLQEIQIQKLEKGYRSEEIEKAKAQLSQVKANLDKTNKDFKRAQKLLKSNSISTQSYDNTKASALNLKAQYDYAKSSLNLLQNGYEIEDILSAKATLESLKAQRNILQINLDDTVLYSPVDGTIITKVYEVGSIVNASQTIVEVAKSDEYWVRSYISEKYLGIVKAGMKASISTDSNKSYEGVVSFISPLAEFTPKTVQTEDLRTDLVYRFRIVLKNVDNDLKQGMPVTISFPELDL
ncbi:HlyD family efflux transporter periplasmic adaptor subunit [Poseidonibacter antarcticus]|uniref:HlyD family efflux transporter periplasmic adaptor subunit n=1 Tax=Poseidonibacter antarcticus TaxID=2478538 RepID=UPI000EF50D08|nr:HlyD family efflux transporter periplasmic adaptor subunit [Poseidonibacter antarcticus]